MKAIKFIVFIFMTGALVACSGGSKDAGGKITREALVGKWQPEKLAFKDIPALLKSQIPKENLEREFLDEAQKKGYLELKEDGTFVFKDTPSSADVTGKWSFDGEKKISIEQEELKIAAGNIDLRIGFFVESVSEDQLEIDFASVYKSMAGVDKIPFFDMKMIMSYKRIK